ncbi:uncharacterized protein FIESC28_04710 [Fusarium coffeatum]|uniref:Uncharacterized protein n=1 Tax=Fusarium coffeatum TaxID=231269 RepID=A0A366RXQ9_9HYPO|nr:uncharacterized protein FIESC28_04710 [Fusarium coffeatum]RBR21867.1 hypothetical protein FIESC28_04710 [Fusarium coffeatum]
MPFKPYMAFKPKLTTIVEEDEETPPPPGTIWRVYCPLCCPICIRNRTCKTVLREQAKAKRAAKLKAKIKIKAKGVDVPKAGHPGETCGKVWEDGTGHYTMKLWDGHDHPGAAENVWYFKGLSGPEIALFENIYADGLPEFTDEDRAKLNANAMGWFDEQLDRVLDNEDRETFEDEVARLESIEID